MKDAQRYSRSQVDDMVKKAMENSSKNVKISVHVVPIDPSQKDYVLKDPSFGVYFYIKNISTNTLGVFDIIPSETIPPPENIVTYTKGYYNTTYYLYADMNANYYSWLRSQETRLQIEKWIENYMPIAKFHELHNGVGNANITIHPNIFLQIFKDTHVFCYKYDHFSSNSSNENVPGMFQLNTPGDNCLYFNSHGDHINGRVFHSYHGVGNYCPDERYYTEGIKMH